MPFMWTAKEEKIIMCKKIFTFKQKNPSKFKEK